MFAPTSSARRSFVILATGAALAAAAPTTAPAAPADGQRGYRSLDGTAGAPSEQDLRSPDTRDHAAGAGTPRDLRSPDTRDRARSYAPVMSGTGVVAEATGFDWPSAGIGAAIGGALVLAFAGLVTLASHRVPRRRSALPH